MKNIINLTPHQVDLLDINNNLIISIPASGVVVRLAENNIQISQLVIEGTIVPIYKKQLTDIIFVRDNNIINYNIDSDNYYIVSNIVRDQLSTVYGSIFITPNDLVRDTNGNVIGCRSFSM